MWVRRVCVLGAVRSHCSVLLRSHAEHVKCFAAPYAKSHSGCDCFFIWLLTKMQILCPMPFMVMEGFLAQEKEKETLEKPLRTLIKKKEQLWYRVP